MARSSLSLLLDYESEDDNDSGYTSGDEKKRKADDYLEIPGPKRKVARSHMECEAMVVDEHPSKEINKTIHLPEELIISTDHVEDSSLHQGRIRSFPHERGNWASLLYIPLDLGISDPYFKSLISAICTSCIEHAICLTPSTEFHVSLSRTLSLRLHWIKPLVEELRSKMRIFSSFSCCLHGLKVYTNDEKTRTFLGLKIWQGSEDLKDLTQSIDETLADYRLPEFYKDFSFHVSLAWCVRDQSVELNRLLPLLEGICKEYFIVDQDMRTFEAEEVIFKTGNRLHNLPLRPT